MNDKLTVMDRGEHMFLLFNDLDHKAISKIQNTKIQKNLLDLSNNI